MFRFMVFKVTFNNISVVSWRSVLLLEETGVPLENTDLEQVTDKLYPGHSTHFQVRGDNPKVEGQEFF